MSLAWLSKGRAQRDSVRWQLASRACSLLPEISRRSSPGRRWKIFFDDVENVEILCAAGEHAMSAEQMRRRNSRWQFDFRRNENICAALSKQ